jgi:hypothetical protein
VTLECSCDGGRPGARVDGRKEERSGLILTPNGHLVGFRLPGMSILVVLSQSRLFDRACPDPVIIVAGLEMEGLVLESCLEARG